jgi:hypothetical protein
MEVTGLRPESGKHREGVAMDQPDLTATMPVKWLLNLVRNLFN